MTMDEIAKALADLDTARRLLTQRTIDHDAVVAERNELAERVAQLEAENEQLRAVTREQPQRRVADLEAQNAGLRRAFDEAQERYTALRTGRIPVIPDEPAPASWSAGAQVIYVGDDLDDRRNVGIVAEATPEDLAQGEKQQCGFEPGFYVLVDFPWAREWVAARELAAAPD